MPDESTLEREIFAVYRGPLEQFVRRRDALAKELRASGRREAADLAKALRKPGRSAWALNNGVADDPATLEHLVAAIGAVQAAQSRGREPLRAALKNLGVTVDEVAHSAARSSIRAGHPVESTSLVAAVKAVIGNADAFACLRAGRLVDVPDAGGLDFLAAAAPMSADAPASAEAVPAPDIDLAEAAREEGERAEAARIGQERAEAARRERQAAEGALREARAREEVAARAVAEAKVLLDGAEQRLQQAKDEEIG